MARHSARRGMRSNRVSEWASSGGLSGARGVSLALSAAMIRSSEEANAAASAGSSSAWASVWKGREDESIRAASAGLGKEAPLLAMALPEEMSAAAAGTAALGTWAVEEAALVAEEEAEAWEAWEAAAESAAESVVCCWPRSRWHAPRKYGLTWAGSCEGAEEEEAGEPSSQCWSLRVRDHSLNGSSERAVARRSMYCGSLKRGSCHAAAAAERAAADGWPADEGCGGAASPLQQLVCSAREGEEE